MEHKIDPVDDLDQEPSHLRAPRRHNFKNKKFIRIVISAVLALAAIGVGFYLVTKDGDDAKPANQNTSEANKEPEEPTMDPAEAAQPVVFKSTKMNIEITHRKDWKLKESTDQTQVTLTSPKVTYQTKDGASTQGVFTLKFSQGGNEATQATINASKAVKDSLLIAYAAPTAEQRHYTNITYAGQAEAFNFIIVTGSVAFKPGDSLDRTLNLSTDDFLIAGGYGADPQNSLSFDDVDPANADQTTAYEQAIEIVKSLKIL